MRAQEDLKFKKARPPASKCTHKGASSAIAAAPLKPTCCIGHYMWSKQHAQQPSTQSKSLVPQAPFLNEWGDNRRFHPKMASELENVLQTQRSPHKVRDSILFMCEAYATD
jgi:hypothetical protein